MRYVPTNDFMHRLFSGEVSRKTILDGLLSDSDIAAIASEHGVDREKLHTAFKGDESSEAGARLRQAVSLMRSDARTIPSGNAFPPSLELATDGGLELIGLFANPLMTTSMILHRPAPPIEDVARAIDPRARAAHSAPILGGVDAATYALDLDVGHELVAEALHLSHDRFEDLGTVLRRESGVDNEMTRL